MHKNESVSIVFETIKNSTKLKGLNWDKKKKIAFRTQLKFWFFPQSSSKYYFSIFLNKK